MPEILYNTNFWIGLWMFSFLYIIARFLRDYNDHRRMAVLLSGDYKEDAIIEHLNYIVNEALNQYVLLNIIPQNLYNINTKKEQEIIEHLSQEVPKRLSSDLIRKLSLIYNESYVGTFIGQYIYMTVVNYVLEFNSTELHKPFTDKKGLP